MKRPLDCKVCSCRPKQFAAFVLQLCALWPYFTIWTWADARLSLAVGQVITNEISTLPRANVVNLTLNSDPNVETIPTTSPSRKADLTGALTGSDEIESKFDEALQKKREKNWGGAE